MRIDKGHGTFQAVLDTLVDRGVKVLAHCTFSNNWKTTLMLVVENDLIGRHALEESGFRFQTESVVVVEVPGYTHSAMEMGRDLGRAGVAVVYSYVGPHDDDKLVAVFRTLDNDRALQTLEESERLADTPDGQPSALPGRTENAI